MGFLAVGLVTCMLLAGCTSSMDDGGGPVAVLPRDEWVWIGDHTYSEATTEGLSEAIDSERVGCEPFEDQSKPREPMRALHYLSVMYCEDRHGDPWAELLPWADGNATADQVYSSLDFEAAPALERSRSLLNRIDPGNLVGFQALGKMQALQVDAEARYSEARNAYATARSNGTFEHSVGNATKFHNIAVDILAAESIAVNLAEAWRHFGHSATAGPGCENAVRGDVIADLDAARLRWHVHQDAIENQSSIALSIALGEATAGYSTALDRLAAAERLNWTPLAVKASSDLAIADAALSTLAPDPSFEIPAGDVVFGEEARARINSTINEIVRSGIGPWAEGRVDRVIRLLSVDWEGLQIQVEPEMETIAAMEGKAVATPCGDT